MNLLYPGNPQLETKCFKVSEYLRMKHILKKLFNSQKKCQDKEEQKYDEVANFETAIEAAGFGKFNFFLIAFSLPMSWMAIFETTSMSYVFPAAQCDLSLSLSDKGMLNAVTYAGAVSSAFVWGILMDTMGRKKLLTIGFLLDGFCAALSSFSQNFTFLMIMKFLGGAIMNGPSAGMATYLSEIHSAKYRSRVPLLIGLSNALGNIYLPFVASFVLPMEFKLIIAESLVLYPWSFYIFLNSLPAIISGIIFFFLPESPKFLMTVGNNDEALRVFRKIYSINTGKPQETYPVKILVEEKEENVDSSHGLRNAWNQIRPLFSTPHLKNLIMLSTLQIFIILGQNTLRLWTPQIFQSINDYKAFNNGSSSNLCEMMKYIQPSKNSSECVVNTNNIEVYQNSMIVSGTTVCIFIVAGTLIGKIGQNRFLVIVSFLAGCFASAIYFSTNEEMATLFIALYASLSSLGSNGVLIVVVNLFPTSLRTMTVSLGMMFTRVSSMSGNMIFPYLLELGCAPPFFFAASALFASSILSMLLPKKNKNFV